MMHNSEFHRTRAGRHNHVMAGSYVLTCKRLVYGRTWRVFPLALGLSLMAGSLAWAGNPQTWNFDVTTTGNNVSYVSPTSVNNTRPIYDAAFEITLLEVRVRWNGIPLGPFDVTNQVPPEQRIGSGSVSGPPPLTIYNDHFQYPAPPATPGFAADVTITLDAAGFGHLDMRNVVLGNVPIDLGPPFGVQTVTLTSVRIAGHVTVTPVPAGDINHDGNVDQADLGILLANYGLCPGNAGYDPRANLDGGDGCVNQGDLGIVLANWGQ